MGWEMTLHKVFFLLCLEGISRHAFFHHALAHELSSKPSNGGGEFRDELAAAASDGFQPPNSLYYEPPFSRPLQFRRGDLGRLGPWPLGIRRLRRFPRQQNLFLDENLRIGRPLDPPLRPDPIVLSPRLQLRQQSVDAPQVASDRVMMRSEQLGKEVLDNAARVQDVSKRSLLNSFGKMMGELIGDDMSPSLSAEPAMRQKQQPSVGLLPEGLAVQDEKDNPVNVSIAKKEEVINASDANPSSRSGGGPGGQPQPSPSPPSGPPASAANTGDGPPPSRNYGGGAPPDGMPEGRKEEPQDPQSTEKQSAGKQLVIEVKREPSGGDAKKDSPGMGRKERYDIEGLNMLKKERGKDSDEDVKGRGGPPPKDDGIEDDKMTDEDKVKKMRAMQKLMMELTQRRKHLVNTLRKKEGGSRKSEVVDGGPKMKMMRLMRRMSPGEQEDDDPMNKKERLRRLMKKMKEKKKLAMLKDEQSDKPAMKMDKPDSSEKRKGKGRPKKRRSDKEGGDPGKEISMLKYLMSKYGDIDRLKSSKTKEDGGKGKKDADSGEHLYEVKKKETKVKIPDSPDKKKKRSKKKSDSQDSGEKKGGKTDSDEKKSVKKIHIGDSKEKKYKKDSGEKKGGRMDSGEKGPKKDSIEKIVIVKNKKDGDSGEKSKGMRKDKDSSEAPDKGEKKKKKLSKIPIESSVFDLSGRSPNFMQGSHPFARIMMMLDSAEYVHKILEFFGDLFIKEFKDKIDLGADDGGSGAKGGVPPPMPLPAAAAAAPAAGEPAAAPSPASGQSSTPAAGSGGPNPESVKAELQEDYGQNYKVPDVYF